MTAHVGRRVGGLPALLPGEYTGMSVVMGPSEDLSPHSGMC